MNEELLLSINPGLVVVEPGGSAAVLLQVQNHSAVVDEYVIEVLGDAASWITLDQPRVPVFPQGTASVQVSLRPPRASSPQAGTIPVGFRVRSTMNPTVTAVEECRVEVKPFIEIAGEIAPKTARGRFSGTHRLRVINKGNAPVNVSVRAEVQQGDCQVSVPGSPLLVGTGQRTTTKIKVRPSGSRLQGADEMHSYRFSLEPQGGPSVAIDAMMRQRPMLGVPIALLVAVALLVVGAYSLHAGGGNPIKTALRWTGMVDVAPSPVPTGQAPHVVPAQPAPPAPATSQPVGGNPTPPPSPSPSPTSTPIAIPTPTHGPTAPPYFLATPIAVYHPPPVLQLCVSLSSVTLTDSVSRSITGANIHNLSWNSNGTCGPLSGTITATYITFSCQFTICGPRSTIATYQISGGSGTYSDPAVGIGVTYTLTLKDRYGATASATSN